VIDLHTGLDPQGPCADISCRDTARLADVMATADVIGPVPRLISLLPCEALPSAETVIPPEIWRNPRFLYVGVEIYLPDSGAGRPEDRNYARALLDALHAEPLDKGV
jgi:hypothetical protein